ncbi:rab-GTPase-TBC domain-containing protein [Collybia nuda]|uniref:Rab-GTPase-TBC domain-containing protein n=1 Tax=Collybia nuda TaxID=64659 RepID=A0A9P5XYH5_9AGAR|nr:rab-GTPase-TBC domain-containing protein [Collybia nuda]
MDASELARWTRFAAKGGIGKCTAVLDCVAESAEDLMFLKDDEITVLMQIPDKTNLYLGYCEGVVGRFSGNDVRFHARLKKPIMTKRSSVSNQAAKSPSPTSGGHTPSPKPLSDPPGTYTHRRVVTLTPRGSMDILSTGLSVPHAPSPDIRQEPPLRQPMINGSASTPSTPPFGSPTQPLRFQKMQLESRRDVALPPPALGQIQAEVQSVLGPPVHITSSSVSSTSTLVESSARPSSSSPPRPPTSHSSPSRNLTSPTSNSTFTALPVHFSPNPISTPLPIANNTNYSTVSVVHPLPPTPPAESPAVTPPASAPSTPPRKSAPAPLDTPTPIAKHDYHPTPPDTSTSSAFDTSTTTTFARVLSDPDSDGEVGIGLTLLQDLADGEEGGWGDLGGDLDSDEDDEELERIRREGRAGLEREAEEAADKIMQSPESKRASHRRSSRTSSVSSRYSHPGSSESDVDGLRYEDTETGHGSVETHEQYHTSNQPDSVVNSPVSPLFFPQSTTRSPQELVFPPVAPLSPSRKGKSSGQYEFPAPPTHTHTYSLTQDSLHDLAGLEHDRERRPSLAPSASSTSDWEGASDIYDDYRYSRFSMGGVSIASGSRVRRMSAASGKSVGARSVGGVSTKSGLGGRRTSVGSSKAGMGVVTGDYPVFVDNPEARSRVDSATSQGGSRPSGDGHGRPSVESLIRARAGSSAAAGTAPAVPSIAEHGILPRGAAHASQHHHQDGDHLNVKGQRHARNESLGGSESDASVYTQSSIGGGSVRSTGVTIPSHPVPSLSQPLGSTSTSTNSSARNSGSNVASSGNRPAPLTLVAPDMKNNINSPQPSAQGAGFQLLHTTWGSPIPSPGHDSNFSPTGYTGNSDGFTGHGTTPASATYFQGAGGLDAVSRALGGSGDSSATGGAASALRQRIEVDRRPSPIPATDDSHHEDVPGRRIVVEDDDDEHHPRPPSAPSSPPSTKGTFKAMIQESPSPEPDLASQQRLGSLKVANRTPTPPEGRKESKDDVILVEPPSPMVPSVPQPTPPLTLSLQVPPASSTPPPASHLRPSLSELRGGQPGQPDQGQRRSLFLPHPNAPKAPSANSPGPMYIAQQQPPPPTQHQVRGGVIQIIKIALAGGGLGPGWPGIPARGPTIYGRTTEDLSASNNPVLMVFSTEPPPATAPLGSPARIYAPTPVTPSSPIRGSFGMAMEARQGTPGNQSEGTEGSTSEDQRASGVIPRANFFPKAGGARPRSRSFSGFNSTTVEVPLPFQRSREEGSEPTEMPSAKEVKQSLSSPSLSTTPLPSSPGGKPSPKPSPLRSSPLSLPPNTSFGAGGASRGMKPPSSPLASGFSAPSVPPSPTTSVNSNRPPHLRATASHSNLSDSTSPRPVPVTHSTLSGNESSPSIAGTSSPQPTGEANSTAPTSRGRPSVDTDTYSIRSNRSGVTSPPAIGRQNSLRTKLSLPNLRRTIGRQDDASSVATGPDGETLQVQDMDFELVRPNLAQFQAARSSEDSGVMGRETSVDVRQDQFRSASPPVSLNNVPKSPPATTDAPTAWQPMKAPDPSAPAESESSMDAHRQREQKWMSVMAAVSPSQSKKSKKVKKLLFDGVPASVRYLVWMHLTDGKARCVSGVYAQLGSRGRVPAFANIERDVRRCFADYPHLQSTQGPVLGLLQAYLTMVPDIQYTTGLTLITGQLSLTAPEEDAFWIFVSIMDTHLRPYFSSSTTQIEVDAALFSRALENADSAVTKKVLMDMGVLPGSICRPWFTSLFVGTLPNDYLNRVWDIFLLEGVPFLIRVALALISCLRRQILESTSEESLLSLLQRPPPSFLPATADAFISLSMSVKLKDDDVRKQRIKMEAQVKRQTQTPRLVSTPGAISLPRS